MLPQPVFVRADTLTVSKDIESLPQESTLCADPQAVPPVFNNHQRTYELPLTFFSKTQALILPTPVTMPPLEKETQERVQTGGRLKKDTKKRKFDDI